ncbi:hypothetical protein GCM10020258_60380 [Sphingomonas yabuuchiae]
MFWNQRNLAPGRGGTRRFANCRVLQRIARADLPLGCDRAAKAEFEPFAALRAREHRPCGVIGVGRAGVGAVKLVDGGGQVQRRADIPFEAKLVIVEPLRLQRGAGDIER